jgi:nitroreductase
MKEKITEALAWRCGIKVFDTSKEVAKDLEDMIIESGRLAPSAYGFQPYKLIKVEDKEIREKLKVASYGQPKVTEAPLLYVIAARTDLGEAFVWEYIDRMVSARGGKKEDSEAFVKQTGGGFENMTFEEKIAYSKRQAYIAFGFMLETAALLGVDAGPMEGFQNDKVDDILGLKEKGLTSVGMMPLGYRGNDDWSTHPKVRISKEDFVVKI